MFIRPIGRPFPRRRPQGPDNQNSDGQEVEEEFYPSYEDVLKVRFLLLEKIKLDGLPLEVVDMIVDAAEYWPSNEVALDDKRTIRKDVDRAVLCTSPLCYAENTLDTLSPKLLPHRTIHPCRKIIFSITSHDQGGHAIQVSDPVHPKMYEGSFTWFDTEVIHNAHQKPQMDRIREEMNPSNMSPRHFGPNDPLLLPRENALQRNRARIQQAKRHTIVWHYLDNTPPDSPEEEELVRDHGRGRGTLAGKQVREMELGDSIIIWARARFPGWVNYVDELSVRIFWAV
ncbi:hypothetical protein BJX99DRAFT_229755 [Aspergillus californicus]